MPNWKKVIVSGSDASLNSLFTSNGITGSLTGNATTADKWKTARKIELIGGITGSVQLDGSSDVQLQADIIGAVTTAPTPTISPGSRNISSNRSITIQEDLGWQVQQIYYTTGSQDPSIGQPGTFLYNGPFQLNTSTLDDGAEITVKAFAKYENFNFTSSIASETYTYTSQPINLTYLGEWNTFSSPYTSSFDVDLLLDAVFIDDNGNTTQIEGTVYELISKYELPVNGVIRPGVGYWVKLTQPTIVDWSTVYWYGRPDVGTSGAVFDILDKYGNFVQPEGNEVLHWCMVGSLGVTSTLSTVQDCELVEGALFGFDGSYTTATPTQLLPGQGYLCSFRITGTEPKYRLDPT